MEYTYKDFVLPYVNNYTLVELNSDEVKRIEKLSLDIAVHKLDESHHKSDCHKGYTRFLTGLLGELAVEKLLDISVVDWSVGNSVNYNKPDIKKYGIGVKTVEKGKFPIIFKNNYYPQIICVKCHSDLICVCGLATVSVLNKYQSDELIIDDNLRQRGTKTGFYGFSHLLHIDSKNNLKKLLDKS